MPRQRQDLRMVPVAAASWAAAWVGTGGDATQLVLGIAGALVATLAALFRRSWWWAAVALVVVAGLAIGTIQHHRLVTGPVSRLAAEQAVVDVELITRGDPRVYPAAGPKPPFLMLDALVRTVDGRGAAWRVRSPVLVTVTGTRVAEWSGLVVGSRVAASGRLVPPDPGSDVAAVLRIRGSSRVTAPPSPGLRLVERVRAGLRRSVAHRGDEPRALVPALVLGDTFAITPEITADFRSTGLTHLTAVSGANLTLLLAFLLLLARWLGVRGWWLRGVGLFGVAVFVALCRTEPSVLRAAAMGLVALAALGAGGGRKGLRTLAVAMAVLLVVDPSLSRSLGFELSVLASGGIVWWAGRWSEVLASWLPRVLAEAVAVPLAAHLATLPVVASISAQVSVVGVLTNAVAGPFVGPATVLGFVAAGLSLVSAAAAAVVGFGAAWAAQAILVVAHVGAGFPGAAWHWPVTPAALALLALASVLGGLAMPYVLGRPALAVLLALVSVAGFLWAPVQPGWPPKDWLFVTCDVGQGDGLLLRAAAGVALVVDAGPDPAPMRRCLDALDVRQVPLLILTHFHSDHVTGLRAVFDHRQVGEIWVSPLASPPAEAEEVRVQAGEHQVPLRVPAVGETGQVGDVAWTVLGPVGEHRSVPGDGESAEENDSSLVLMVTVRGVRLLLTGDVEPAGQQAIVASGADLHADVLKLPHHGSGNQDPAFIAATGARVAIASAGLNNDYGHPAPKTVRLVESLGMTLFRTDLDGSVAVTVGGGRLSAVTEHARTGR